MTVFSLPATSEYVCREQVLQIQNNVHILRDTFLCVGLSASLGYEKYLLHVHTYSRRHKECLKATLRAMAKSFWGVEDFRE